MYAVEVHRDGEDLAGPMEEMRMWLDGKGIQPALFRMSIIPGGTVFRLEFAGRSEAAAFARAFGGTVVPDHPLVA
jgi:hypothetical protein